MRTLLALTAVIAIVAAACGDTVTPSPSPSASPTATPKPSASPSPTATPVGIDRTVVYFARDRLPPVAVPVPGAGVGATAEARIRSRLDALFSTAAPSGLFNIALASRARVASVRVDGDLTTIDFTVGPEGWNVHGSAGTLAFIQQLIFTATEEPGIARALITENGHAALVGEGIEVDHPATREQVAGYVAASLQPVTWRTDPRPSAVSITSRLSVDTYAPGLARFVVDTGLRGVDAKADLGFTLAIERNDERAQPELGKWRVMLTIPGTVSEEPLLRVVDRTPVRAILTRTSNEGTRYDIGLDDLRPWRAAMLYEPLRLVVDVGGDPAAVSPNIALYAPAFGAQVRPGGAMSGLLRAFEAQFEYRIRDASGRLIQGYARASLGTSELWGTFDVELPALAVGAASLEILLRSPRDGEITETVFTSFEYGP